MKKSIQINSKISYLSVLILIIIIYAINPSFAQAANIAIIKETLGGGNGGTITVNGVNVENGANVPLADDSDVNIIVAAKAGYYIKEVYYNSEANMIEEFPIGTFEIDISGIQGANSFKAVFQRIYQITTSTEGNGSITPMLGAELVPEGVNRSYTFIPDSGYMVDNVWVNGAWIGPRNEYSITNIKSNYDIFVIFTPLEHTVETKAGSGGTIAPMGITKVPHAGSIVVSVTPDQYYGISQVYVNGQPQIEGDPLNQMLDLTLDPVNDDYIVEAFFERTHHVITVKAGEGGIITPAGDEQGKVIVSKGSNQTFMVSAAQGYHISEIKVAGVPQEFDPNSTTVILNLGPINSDFTIEATFEPEYYFIFPSAKGNGTITPSEFAVVPFGGSATFTMTPDDCHEIKDVLVDGESVMNGAPISDQFQIDQKTGIGTYTFNLVGNKHTIDVIFEPKYFTIDVSKNEGGYVSPTQDGEKVGPFGGTFTVEVPCGGGWIFKIEPATCYTVKEVIVDGKSWSNKEEVIFSGVMEDHTVDVKFEPMGPFTITAVVKEGKGSFEPNGDSEGRANVECGEDKEYTIIPEDCYKIKDVKVDGKSVMGDVRIVTEITGTGKYTFKNVRKDHTLEVSFEEITYKIEVTQNKNGRIEPAGEVNVKCGANQTFKITPDECFEIDDVLVDGESVKANVKIDPKIRIGQYTFEDVRADHTITATFKPVAPLTIKASVKEKDYGKINPSGDVKVDCGKDQTFTITPEDCYKIKDVIVDGKSVIADTKIDPKTGIGTYTFEKVLVDHEIVAVFEKMGPFKITGVPIPEGKVLPSNPITVDCGEDQSVTIEPNDCWEIDTIDVQPEPGLIDIKANPNIKVVDPDKGSVKYTFVNVRKDYTITVKFKKIKYEITSGVIGTGGSINPVGIATVDCGTDANYKMIANVGFIVDEVFLDAVPIGARGAYTFKNVRSDHTISVRFIEIAKATRVIKTLGIANFEPSGDADGNVYVGYGQDINFTITPDEDHAIKELKVDDKMVDLQNDPNVELIPKTSAIKYKFTNVTDNHTIEAICVLLGDIDGDGVTSSKDALMTLRFAVGMDPPTDAQKLVADMNRDNLIRSDDALLILRKSVGLSAPGIDDARFANVTIPDVYGISGEKLRVPVVLNDGHLIAGGDICIVYDSSVLRATKVTADTETLLVSNIEESNTIHISFAGAHGLGGKALAEIEFDIIADETSPLEFKNVAFYGADSLPLSFAIKHGKFESWAMKPSQGVLLQNFPNPFNPETWIPFRLSKPGTVNINIYSASGQLVRRLNLGHRDVGDYSSRDRAIYWDGKNDDGEQVTSGIYFYSIKSGDFTATKKMIISR